MYCARHGHLTIPTLLDGLHETPATATETGFLIYDCCLYVKLLQKIYA